MAEDYQEITTSDSCPKSYLCNSSIIQKMSRMRKIAFIGIGVVVVATIIFKILNIYPGIVAVHALPFCMLLLIDISRKRSANTGDQPQQ